MAYNHEYPYVDPNRYNSDWILNKIKELEGEMNTFEALNKITFDGEWDISKQYPAWCIVNTNGGTEGYISIKPVPAGVLITNTEYWSSVVNYTATIADLQNRVVQLENDMSTTNDRINALINHHWLLVTDSYGDPSATGSANTWLEYFESLVGGSGNVTKTYRGGYGFSPQYDPTKAFVDLITPGALSTGIPADYDVTLPTDIVVIGGFNDRLRPVSDLKTAIGSFVTYAKATFPNLKNVYIGAAGWSMNHEHLADLANGKYIKAYSECAQQGAIYLNGMENVLHGFNLYNPETAGTLLLGNQYVHPNDEGSKRIAIAAVNAINGGASTNMMPWDAFTFTVASGITCNNTSNISIAQYQDNGTIFLQTVVNAFFNSSRFSITNTLTEIEVGTVTGGYYNSNDGVDIPCLGFVAGGDYAVNTPMDMFYNIKGGKLYVRLIGNLADNTTKGATYIYIFPCSGMVNTLHT